MYRKSVSALRVGKARQQIFATAVARCHFSGTKSKQINILFYVSQECFGTAGRESPTANFCHCGGKVSLFGNEK